MAGFAGLLLGWRPDAFWTATPAELAVVLAAMAGDEVGVSADEVERLRTMFPD